MGKNTGFIKYAFKSPFKNTIPMYLYGSCILSILVMLEDMYYTNSLSSALSKAFEYYILKLTPFPIDVFLTYDGFVSFCINIVVAVLIGSFVAGVKWRINV